MRIKNEVTPETSFKLEDNDFLSKHIHFKVNEDGTRSYFPYRSSDDTFIRLIYPDTAMVPRPGEPGSQESKKYANWLGDSLIGHYIDNWYNPAVRKYCSEALREL